MHKGRMSLQAMSTAMTAVQTSTVPTVYLPLDYLYGGDHKVSTNLSYSGAPSTIEVVVDLGSDSFWVTGPDTTENWGCRYLGCQGSCNITLPTFYDYTASPDATPPKSFPGGFYSYGGFSKNVQANITVNDTLVFTNSAGQANAVPHTEVAVARYINQKIEDAQCVNVPTVDLGIMGLAPYRHNDPLWNTTGPSFRQGLLEQDAIDTPIQSLWFDEAPGALDDAFTGGVLFGGIDTSKFTGPLVKVPSVKNGLDPVSVGYNVPRPDVRFNGASVTGNQREIPFTTCLIDSGSHGDDLPIEDEDKFFNATGITRSPIGYIAYPTECKDIPADKFIEIEFVGVNASESVSVKMAIRNYGRTGADMEPGFCWLNLDVGGCLLGAPFMTNAFFVADDERQEIALAQGGVSKRGSGPDESKIIARIP